MSQQEMEYGTSNPEKPPHTYTGYATFNSYTPGPTGQKLTVGRSASPGQRLALAIVSLVSWIVVFLIIIIGIASTSYNSDNWLQFVLFFGLLIFSAIVILVNILFNRRR